MTKQDYSAGIMRKIRAYTKATISKKDEQFIRFMLENSLSNVLEDVKTGVYVD